MLSREFLIQRGYCCGHGCLMCPYEPKHTKGNKNLMSYGNLEKKIYLKFANKIKSIYFS
jgi:2,5-diketo-D-gluconate reductase A